MDTHEARSVDDVYDEWLVVRCQLGERAAFDPLIARWHPPLCNYASRMLNDRDAAADVVQEVWLRVIRALPQLRDATRFRPWLFGIARRVLMDRLRVRYAEPPMEPLDFENIEEPADDEERTEDLSLLRAGLEQLPLLEREVLVLFYLRELSLNDVAAIEGIPLGTVKSRLFRARRLLRRELDRQGQSR